MHWQLANNFTTNYETPIDRQITNRRLQNRNTQVIWLPHTLFYEK